MKINLIILMTAASLIFADSASAVTSTHRKLMNNFFDFGAKFAKHALMSHNESAVYSPIGASLLMAGLATGADGNTFDEMNGVIGLFNLTASKTRDYITEIVNYLSRFEGHRIISSFLASKDRAEEKNDYFNSFPSEHTFDMHHIVYAKWPEEKYFCPHQNNNKSFLAYVNHDVSNLRFLKPWSTHLNNIVHTQSHDNVLRGGMLGQVNKFRHGITDMIDAKWIDIPLRSDNLHDGLSLIILLPNEDGGLKKILENFDKFRYFFHDVKESILEVWMPHFHFSLQQYCVLDIWKKVGLSKMFQADANFVKIFGNKPTPLRFGASTHAASLSFNMTPKNELHDSLFIYEPIDLNFESIEFFKIDRSFVGVIVSQGMMHFAFQVLMPENQVDM